MCKKENQAPLIQSTTAHPPTIKTGETTQLTCNAIDPDGDQLTYSWSSSNGSFPIGKNENSISWKAPDEPGDNTISVKVNDGKDETSSSVKIVVEANPKLSVSATSINFETTDSVKTFKINNIGTGALSWSVSEELHWLTASPQSGETTTETDSTTLTVNRENLAPGSYNGIITLITNNGRKDIFVNMIVEEKPVLFIAPHSLAFGDSITTDTLLVKNTGNGSLFWMLSEEAAWLTMDNTTGFTAGETDKIAVVINRADLAPGNYSTTISVTSNGGNQEISVSMVVPENPILLLSKVNLTFDQFPDMDLFTIRNSGTGTLTWSITEDISWLTIDTISGSLTSGSHQVTVIINRKELAPGTYSGMLTVSSNGGSQNVEIALEIPEEPELAVIDSVLAFDMVKTQITFSIQNKGTGTLNWALSENLDWLTLDKTSGSSTTSSDVVTATVDRSDLPPGIYDGVIQVNSNGGNLAMQVTMLIPEEPELNVLSAPLLFDSSTKEVRFAIENSGTGILDWELTENLSWLRLSYISGSTSTEEPHEVVAYIDWNGLAGGTYSGVISVSSDGGNQEINVTMEVPDYTGTFVDSRDGNEYSWVRIGNQIWMAENMAYLPKVNAHSEGSHTEPFYYVMEYSGTNVNMAKTTDYFKTYGVLYNWTAAQVACPAGWHLPTDTEFRTLQNYLINSGYGFGGSGGDIAKSLAAKTNWNSNSFPGTPGNDPKTNNASGFSGLPGGDITNGATFAVGYNGYWYSATKTNNYISVWYLTATSTDFLRMGTGNFSAYNVRYIKD